MHSSKKIDNDASKSSAAHTWTVFSLLFFSLGTGYSGLLFQLIVFGSGQARPTDICSRAFIETKLRFTRNTKRGVKSA